MTDNISITITCNKNQFYAKIIILTIIFTLIGVFVYYRPPIKFDDAPIEGIIFLILVWTLVGFLLIIMTLQLIFLPKGVDIDQQNKTLTLKFLFAKPLTVLPKDLIDFSSIVVKTKSTSYDGVLIRTSNGKEFVLGDFNLQDFRPIKTFLEETNVTFTGHYKFSFISYFFKSFR